jgi:hypothetical protein
MTSPSISCKLEFRFRAADGDRAADAADDDAREW